MHRNPPHELNHQQERHGLGSCSQCGASLKPLSAGAHATYVLRDTQLNALLQLFDKRTDYVQCEACGTPIDAETAVIVLCSDSRTALVGTDSKDHGVLETISQLEPLPSYSAVEKFDSLDELRSRVKAHLRQALPLVNTLLAAPPDTFDEIVAKKWRDITPFVLNVGRLRLRVDATERLDIPAINKLQAEELSRRLSGAQAHTWGALTTTWALTTTAERSLDTDLDQYICPDVMFPNSVDFFLEAVCDDRFPVNSDDLIASYVKEAVIAQVCSAINRQNPRRSQWASAFFNFEILLELATCADDIDLDPLTRRRINAHRAHALITYRDAWNNFANRLAPASNLPTSTIRAVARRCGYEVALDDAIRNRRVKVHDPRVAGDSVEEIIQVLFQTARDPERSAQVLLALDYYLDKLVVESRIDDLIELGQRLAAIFKSDSTKAQLYGILGKCFKRLRAPKKFLEIIGETSQPWENNLLPGDQAQLWTERANALRLLGRSDAALSWIERILQADTSSLSGRDLRVAQLNRAIFLRETGAPDLAYTALSELIDRAEHPNELILIHMALATTHFALGRYADARIVLQKALEIAVPPWNAHAPLICANLAAVSVLSADTDGFISAATKYLDDMIQTPSGKPSQPSRAQVEIDRESLVLASALAAHWEIDLDGREGFRHVRDSILQALTDVRGRAEARGDTTLLLDVLLLEASLAEPDNSRGAWQACYDAHRKHSKPQRPEVLLAMAWSAYARSDVAEARQTLTAVPQAFADEFGGAIDLSETALAPVRLESRLNALLQLVRSTSDPASHHEDVRLIAELKRSAVTNAMQSRRRPDTNGLRLSMSASQIQDALTRFVDSSGPIAVLEWIDDGRSTNLLLTSTQDDESSAISWLEPPNIDANDVGQRLRQRLANWRPSRKGDPFDVIGWRPFSKWLNASLDSLITTEHHVVIIDNRATNFVPWHVAVAPSRTVSYASSWTELIELSTLEYGQPHRSIGVVSVPRFRESDAVSNAFRKSLQRTNRFATARDLHFHSCTGVKCDSDGFSKLLASSTIVKILCHGFVDPETVEVAFMLSHDGELPLAHSVAAASRTAQPHRFSWRACQLLSPVPPVLFSIACSTGLSHTVGLGDRLGFHSAFRSGGGRALVAPRWDVVVPDVLPAMDAALESYLDGQHSLAKAVQHACSILATSQPPWISWALCVEGDWR